MPEEFIDRKTDITQIEKGVKNKFRWNWLEEKDSNGDFLSDYVRKLVQPGLAYCVFCNHRLDYSTKGKSFVKRLYAESEGHKKRRKCIKQNQTLPALFQATASLQKGESPSSSSAQSNSLPYGAAPDVKDSGSTAVLSK